MLNDHRDNQFDKVARMALNVVSILSRSEVGMETESSDPATSSSKDSPRKKDRLSPVPSSSSSATTSSSTGKQQQAAAVRPQPRLNEYFRKFVVELLKMFDSDRPLLENKGSFIIR